MNGRVLCLVVVALSAVGCQRMDRAALEKELKLAQELNRKGDLAGSVAHLERVLRVKPLESDLAAFNVTLQDVSRVAGQDHYYLGNFKKAITLLEPKATSGALNAPGRVDLALCHLARGGLKEFRAIVGAFVRTAGPRALADELAALDRVATPLVEGGANPEEVFRAGWRFGVEERHLAAYALTTLALNKGFDKARCHYQRGVAALSLGKTAVAIYDLDRVVDAAPEHVDALHERGNAKLQAGLTREAAEDFQRVVAIRPKAFDAHFMLGEIHREQGAWKEAREEYRQALQLSDEAVRAKQGGWELVSPRERMFKAERVNTAARRRLREISSRPQR